jgi:hypothetical protein
VLTTIAADLNEGFRATHSEARIYYFSYSAKLADPFPGFPAARDCCWQKLASLLLVAGEKIPGAMPGE